MSAILSIAAGGALGAVSRHFLNTGVSYWLQQPFPYGTLSANMIGSFLMGVLIAFFAAVYQPATEAKLFLVVGFLGSFTTFSTFSLDTVTLFHQGRVTEAAVYIAASLILSIGGLVLGSALVWKFVS